MLIGFLLSDISIFMTCFSIPKEYLLSSFKRTKTFLCFFMLNNLLDEKSKETLKVDRTITKISRGIKWIRLWNNLFFASSLAKILIVTNAYYFLLSNISIFMTSFCIPNEYLLFSLRWTIPVLGFAMSNILSN